VPSTGDVTHNWCPLCEPDVDPLKELVVIRWCHSHRKALTGADDAILRDKLAPESMPICDEKTDPATQRAWAEFLGR
jgi:hypothetical protein